MKKALIICGLAAAMLLVCLFACSSQAEEPPTPSAAQTQPVETPTPTETPEPQETSPQAEPMSIAKRLPTQDELLELFQIIYDMGQSYKDFRDDDDAVLELELNQLHIFFDVDSEFTKPADLDEQYKAWREANHSKEPVPSENLVDQNIIDQGFEADIDPETGDIGYWNPNTEEDPVSQGNVGVTDWDAHHIDPTAPSSIFTIPDDPWANQPELDYGGTGG